MFILFTNIMHFNHNCFPLKNKNTLNQFDNTTKPQQEQIHATFDGCETKNQIYQGNTVQETQTYKNKTQ